MVYQYGRNAFRTIEEGIEREWVLGNGIGGFAGGTIIGANSRAHHSYLVAALNPPVDRLSILGKTQETIVIGNVEHDLASQQYINWNKEGQKYLQRFTLDGVPTYFYQVYDVAIKKTVAIEYGKNTVAVCYEITNGMDEAIFNVIPLLTCKALGSSLEKNELKFDMKLEDQVLTLIHEKHKDITIKFYASEGEYYDRKQLPVSMATPNYQVEENLVYGIDNRNGALGVDHYSTPYQVQIALKPFERKCFYVKCTVEELDTKDGFKIVKDYQARMEKLAKQTDSTQPLVQKLAQAADHFIVKRDTTGLKTILAGFPWFTDWGRDTMIAFQGLTLCTKRYEDAKEILESFSKYVKNGLIPNVFPNHEGDAPGYNTVDGSMWYFYSVDRYLHYTGNEKDYEFIRQKIYPCLKEIIKAYKEGTDFSIKMDTDGLIMAGSDLDQITWMDVRVGDWVVTPRHGKPVEISALWYNALKVMEKLSTRFGEDATEYTQLAESVKQSFNEKFWNEALGCLYDVVDKNDSKIRPNQIWAVFLPYTMLDKEKELKIVQKVYKHLYTPYGLRSLSYEDEGYKKEYIGKLINRDAAYHMGTTWAFPIGAFISSYCKVHNHSKEAIQTAKEMCSLFEDHMNDGCINGIAEIFDGDFACTSRGCYTQAWSVGEVLRAYVEDVLPYLDK